MKKSFLTILLSVIFLIILKGQSYDPVWSPITKIRGVETGSTKIKFLTSDSDSYFASTYSRKEGTKVYNFDLNNKLISKKNVTKGSGEGYYIKTKKGLFNYDLVPDKKRKFLEIKVGAFKNGIFTKPKVIYSYKYQRFGMAYSGDHADLIDNWKISSDSNYVSFVSPVLSMKEKQQVMTLMLLDAKMNKLWANSRKFNYSDTGLIIVDAMPHDGYIYLIGKVNRNKKRVLAKKYKNSVFDYKIFKVSENEIEEFDISLGNNLFPTDAKLIFQKESDSAINLSGFYSDVETNPNSKGVFLIKLALNGEVVSKELKEFESDILNELRNNDKKKVDNGLSLNYKYDIIDYFMFDNGYLGFISEYRDYKSQVRNQRSITTYERNNFMVTIFSSQGKFIKNLPVTRNIKLSALSPLSLSRSVLNDKLYLVYNDHKTKSGKKGTVNTLTYTDMTVVSSSGEIELQKTLFTNKDTKRVFLPYSSGFINNYFIAGTKGYVDQKFSFGLVPIK